VTLPQVAVVFLGFLIASTPNGLDFSLKRSMTGQFSFNSTRHPGVAGLPFGPYENPVPSVTER